MLTYKFDGRKGLTKLMLLLMCLLLVNEVFALPPLPSQFYGSVIINGIKAPIGTNISAYDLDNVLCGFTTTNEKGKYILSCKGDSFDSEIDEGAKPGEKIRLHINNIVANMSKDSEWKSGSFDEIDINIDNVGKSRINASPVANNSYLYLYYAFLILSIVIFIIIITIRRARKI